MAENGKNVEVVYNEGIREVTKIIQQGDESQQDEAFKTLDRLTAMMLAGTLKTVKGRTELLNGLIKELTQVIESIQQDPPYAGALDSITGVIEKAQLRLSAK